VHPRPKRVIFLQLCSHIPISVQTKRSKVPGRVTPGFNETRDGPLGALSEVSQLQLLHSPTTHIENMR
jgi:hypothetical protein